MPTPQQSNSPFKFNLGDRVKIRGPVSMKGRIVEFAVRSGRVGGRFIASSLER